MVHSYRQLPSSSLSPSPSNYVYPEDNNSWVSYDSLAYSDITNDEAGSTRNIATESSRLNGYKLPPPEYLNRNGKISNYFQSRSNTYSPTGHDTLKAEEWFQKPKWLENIREWGIQGMRVQGIADASLVKSVVKSTAHGPVVYIGGSRKKERLEVEGTPPDGCESTIMLIRHCEKGDLRSHCNYHGFERAAYLATLFGDEDERWPTPSKLYALKAGGRGGKGKKVNYREVETVQFLAEKLDIDINQDFEVGDRKELVRTMLESLLSGNQCGKLTLVSWKHSDLPKVAHLLGCGPFEGCPMDYRGKEFDEVWQIKYVYRSFHHGSKDRETHEHWDIFGSVQYEHFDPLAFSKRVGDYPAGGTDHGGRWVETNQKLYD